MNSIFQTVYETLKRVYALNNLDPKDLEYWAHEITKQITEERAARAERSAMHYNDPGDEHTL